VSKRTLHPASAEEADALWPAVNAAHLFDSHARSQQFRTDAPWRVQVTDAGEAVVLEEWRSHLDVLAMRGLWCAGDRVPELAAQIARLAAVQGYGRVLSPLVAEEVAPVYQRAGMTVCDTIVALRFDRRGSVIAQPVLPAGVRLRHALADDLPELVRIDAECFNDFWRYDADRLSRYFVEDRLIVAEGSQGVIGYTLSTVVRGSGTLGRLAVRPSVRRRGVGEALLCDALEHLVRTGVGTVSVCTQEDNRASRALYRKIGMTELSGRLVFLMGPARHAGKRE
jgi:[ribosomal protein S18]-alanine N-acetyltransferase